MRFRFILKGGDLFIERGEKYDDYREQLVDRKTFAEEVDGYGEVTGIEVDPKAFVGQLRTMLVERAAAVDKSFPQNAHAKIVNGRLSLGRLDKTVKPAEAEQLDLTIRDRLAPVSILDVLIDAEQWLDLQTLQANRWFREQNRGSTPTVCHDIVLLRMQPRCDADKPLREGHQSTAA